MAFYSYVGRDAQGLRIEGTLESASSALAADRLAASGVVPVEIVEAAPSAAALWQGVQERFSARRIGHLDVLMFTRQMYTLLKAGVPIMRALAGLQESAMNRAFAAVLKELRESLDAGLELSQALARHPAVFFSFYVAMVRVGESTGRLEEVFLRLFDHLEFQKFMREQVRSALRYPMFVMAAMGIALVVINLFVIPAFAKVFKGLRAELPVMTKLLIGFSDFTLAWWPVLLAGGAALVIAFRLWVRTKGGRLAWDRFRLHIPVAGKIVRKATLARFARSFAMAARSGVPLVQGLTLAAQVVENAYIGGRIEDMRMGVERGETILRTAIEAKIFTPVVLQMIMVGEESGALDDMMQEIAGMYQREVEYELKTLSAQIEPILIVALGVMVLILALGVFLPMWDLGKAAIRQ
ncbi:MAG TPA: MSHA biogenesis protein MshG [Rhodocyclaceae bacterium]|nr:MAG: MSHA biogenesis protein MshG [Betaproteobacteria bacterium CG2_30_68_42]PJA58418.1 MAG: MSHA biogenesis protein MshG [Rhodocyclales bacterium CG_4_9_14_3_um_filter_68_10]HCX34428.1 MSHA biogenesis protein MshG [Rhodocyclaceae bacterium]